MGFKALGPDLERPELLRRVQPKPCQQAISWAA